MVKNFTNAIITYRGKFFFGVLAVLWLGHLFQKTAATLNFEQERRDFIRLRSADIALIGEVLALCRDLQKKNEELKKQVLERNV